MLRIAPLLGLLLVLSGAAPCRAVEELHPAASAHVLFVGNSLTYVNDLPGMLTELAALAGDTIRTQSVSKPNYSLEDHFADGAALAAIRSEKWTFVVFQQGPSSLPESRRDLIMWTEKFDERVRVTGARTALYAVWPDHDRLAYFRDVQESYRLAAAAVGGVLFPVNAAWQRAWKADASLSLYGTDGFHPSPMGTYLAALVMYERITGHDARGTPVPVKAGPIPSGIARLLQQAAHEANAD